MGKVRVLVVDDKPLMRMGLTTIVRQSDDLELVGEAENGREAVTLCSELTPDVVLMDLQMPEMDGPTATRHIIEKWPEITVVAITTFTTESFLIPALQSGARGYLLKDAHPEEIVGAILAAHQGNAVLSPDVASILVSTTQDQFTASRDVPLPLENPLTPREIEVVQAMARGLNNLEIASELYLSEATVKAHVSHILAKFEARDRVQAIIKASQHGVVKIS